MARADRNTETRIQDVFYRDFTTSFRLNPVTGQLATVSNEESVKQMIRNLVLTVMGERRHQPLVGSKVYNLNFEPADSVTRDLLIETIVQSINNHLPMVRLVDVNVKDPVSRRSGSALNDPNAYVINITFGLHNTERLTTFDVPLKRVR